jgi:hypothetical protein
MCSCHKYSYNFSQTFTENEEASTLKQIVKVPFNIATLMTTHWVPFITDNRCDCGHLDSEHRKIK